MFSPHTYASRKMAILGTIMSLTVALLLNPAAVKPATAEVVNNWYVLNWTERPKLYQVNKSTGALTVLAEATQDTGLPNNNTGAAGFDVDSTNGVGYFIPYSNVPAKLWKVDLISGQFTFIANSDAEYVTAMDIGINGDVWIAADSLDGQGQGFGRVNTTTGDSTFLSAGPERISALATSASGVLHAFTYSRKVYTVNTSNFTFTLIGTTQENMMAADIDGSGDIILTSFFGNVSRYDFDTNTSTSLFTMRDSNNQTIMVEALAVGGPTNGQNLNQAIAGIEAAAAVPVIANGYRADKLGTVYFAPLSSKLSKAAKKQIKASVIANPSAIYKVTGHVQKSIIARNAKNDADLSLARARAIETYLVSLGAGVNFTVVVDAGLVPAKNGKSSKARRATLYAMTPVVQ